MRNYFLLMLMVFSFWSCETSKRVQYNTSDTNIDNILLLIQDEYRAALVALKAMNRDSIVITDAEIELKVTKTRTSNGELKVLIFKPSGKRSLSNTTSVVYKLTDKKYSGGGTGLVGLSNHKLRDVIVNAALEFMRINSGIGDLVGDSFEINMVFSIEYSASMGIVFEVWGLSLDGSHERGRVTEHQLTLTFKKKK